MQLSISHSKCTASKFELWMFFQMTSAESSSQTFASSSSSSGSLPSTP
jgi:hypothetical protein